MNYLYSQYPSCKINFRSDISNSVFRVLCKLFEALSNYENLRIRISSILVDILYRSRVWKFNNIFPNSILSISADCSWCWNMLGNKCFCISHLGRGGSAQIGGEKFRGRRCFLGRLLPCLLIKINSMVYSPLFGSL